MPVLEFVEKLGIDRELVVDIERVHVEQLPRGSPANGWCGKSPRAG